MFSAKLAIILFAKHLFCSFWELNPASVFKNKSLTDIPAAFNATTTCSKCTSISNESLWLPLTDSDIDSCKYPLSICKIKCICGLAFFSTLKPHLFSSLLMLLYDYHLSHYLTNQFLIYTWIKV